MCTIINKFYTQQAIAIVDSDDTSFQVYEMVLQIKGNATGELPMNKIIKKSSEILFFGHFNPLKILAA